MESVRRIIVTFRYHIRQQHSPIKGSEQRSISSCIRSTRAFFALARTGSSSACFPLSSNFFSKSATDATHWQQIHTYCSQSFDLIASTQVFLGIFIKNIELAKPEISKSNQSIVSQYRPIDNSGLKGLIKHRPSSQTRKMYLKNHQKCHHQMQFLTSK